MRVPVSLSVCVCVCVRMCAYVTLVNTKWNLREMRYFTRFMHEQRQKLQLPKATPAATAARAIVADSKANSSSSRPHTLLQLSCAVLATVPFSLSLFSLRQLDKCCRQAAMLQLRVIVSLSALAAAEVLEKTKQPL